MQFTPTSAHVNKMQLHTFILLPLTLCLGCVRSEPTQVKSEHMTTNKEVTDWCHVHQVSVVSSATLNFTELASSNELPKMRTGLGSDRQYQSFVLALDNKDPKI